jgi:hypothetical protein
MYTDRVQNVQGMGVVVRAIPSTPYFPAYSKSLSQSYILVMIPNVIDKYEVINEDKIDEKEVEDDTD